MLSLEWIPSSLSVSVVIHYQVLKMPPLINTMQRDDCIFQTNLLAIDIDHVVRVALYVKLVPRKLTRYSHSLHLI